MNNTPSFKLTSVPCTVAALLTTETMKGQPTLHIMKLQGTAQHILQCTGKICIRTHAHTQTGKVHAQVKVVVAEMFFQN